MAVMAVMERVAGRRSRLAGMVTRRYDSDRERSEQGQISLLVLGFTIIALMLIIGGVDVTAVQLSRARLLDTADSAALDASDALDSGSAYQGGLQSAVPVTDGSVNITVESRARSGLR